MTGFPEEISVNSLINGDRNHCEKPLDNGKDGPNCCCNEIGFNGKKTQTINDVETYFMEEVQIPASTDVKFNPLIY